MENGFLPDNPNKGDTLWVFKHREGKVKQEKLRRRFFFLLLLFSLKLQHLYYIIHIHKLENKYVAGHCFGTELSYVLNSNHNHFCLFPVLQVCPFPASESLMELSRWAKKYHSTSED